MKVLAEELRLAGIYVIPGGGLQCPDAIELLA